MSAPPGGRVEILVSCQDLVNLDVFTKTDPMCVLFVKLFGQWKEHGRTEAIRESLNPRFTQVFLVDVQPDVQQHLMFSVYDIDSRSSDLRQHDFVGCVEVTLDSLIDVTKPWTTTSRILRVAGDPKSRGLINMTAEIVRETRSKAQFHVAGHKLGKVGFLNNRKPDTYLEIGRQINSVTYHPVFRTEVQHKTRSPSWRPFDVSMQRLCNDDLDRPIQFSCWHTNYGAGFKSAYDKLGEFVTTARRLLNMKRINNYKSFHLICPKKEKKNKKDVTSGSVRFYQFRVDKQHSLMDFVRGGCKLRLIIAIDFTASNGTVSDELSLHSCNDAKNQYLATIQTLGASISRYDVEQKIAVFGFGAKRTSDDNPLHCFPLRDNQSNIWVSGVKGVTEAYTNALPTLTFAGPTCVAPVIATAADVIRDVTVTQGNQIYHVLLILTDGVINDIDETIHRLIDTSGLPLSVIIVGVGPADFSLMEQFHTRDNRPLADDHSKRTATRANVHFTALKKEALVSGGSLAVVQEALASLSSQFLQYMKCHNITPNRPRVMKADPRSSWVGSTAEEREGLETMGMISAPSMTSLASRGSRGSAMFTQMGPFCPTCGSSVGDGLGGSMYDVHTF
ncbi:copine-3-like [Haliotis cracherodii]|uniref:copine-3-like n=1 Tax=Haliotis cracherodii TaxID=6455 RepID=UPI0039ED2329